MVSVPVLQEWKLNAMYVMRIFRQIKLLSDELPACAAFLILLCRLQHT